MKNMQKSVRMTNEVYAAVVRFRGDGFNQKFENLVTRYIFDEKRLHEKLDGLRAESEQLTKEIQAKKQLLADLIRIEVTIRRLIVDCNSLNDKFYLDKQ